MKVLVGSKNPGKILGVKQAFEQFYDNIQMNSYAANSNVSDEPVNDDIYQGANNRVQNLIKYCKEKNINVDFFVAVESGITNKFGKWLITNIAIIQDKFGFQSFGTSASFPIPDKYVKDTINSEFGKVMDKLFASHDLKKSKGGISILTHDKITRIDLNKQATTMALTQFVNGDVWKD